jgi:hypothetical protein
MWHLQRAECVRCTVKSGVLAQHTFSWRALVTTILFAIWSLIIIRRTMAHAYDISAGVNLNPFFDCTAAGGSGVTERSRARMVVAGLTTVSEVCASEVA